MKLLCICLLVASTLIACRKKNPPAAVTPAPPTEQAPPAPDGTKVVHSKPSPVAGQLKPSNLPPDVEFQSSTAFRELSTGLQLFVSNKKRFPSDLEEIKAAGFLPNGIPTPPPGIRLVIDQKTKTVQAVR